MNCNVNICYDICLITLDSVGVVLHRLTATALKYHEGWAATLDIPREDPALSDVCGLFFLS